MLLNLIEISKAFLIVKDLKITKQGLLPFRVHVFKMAGFGWFLAQKNPVKSVKVALIEGKNVVLMLLDM